MKVEFRRNHYKGGKGGFPRNRILIFVVVLIAMFLAFSLKNKSKPAKSVTQNIYVNILDKDKIIINSDTTNFDHFASVLKKEISRGKNLKKMVHVNLPKDKKAGEFFELIQIINAFENIELKLTANN